MASFLEKLKKGMGIEISDDKEDFSKVSAEKIAAELDKESDKETEKENKPSPKKNKTALKKGIKKIQVEGEDEELKEKLTKTKKIEEKIEEAGEEVEESEPVRQSFALKDLTSQEGQLAVDVYQTENEIVIQSAIAGVKPQDLDISIEEDFISIKGVRKQPNEKEEKNYFYQECFWGSFARQIILPEETDPSRAEAEMREGVLTIRIPKIERKKKRKIEVKS